MPSKPIRGTNSPPIPLQVPRFCGNEWKYLKECLDSNWVSSVGGFVDRFERAVADYLDARYAVATMNGTSALHVALLAAGIEPDDEVLVSTLTFIAPANAIRYVQAWPVFIDAEQDYWQMDPNRVAEFLVRDCVWRDGGLRDKGTGRRVRAILPVHILGHPVDIDPILDLAAKYELTVIEDAAESLGAKYKGRRPGNLASIGCVSFNGNKIVTTGGGGMVVTDSERIAHRARYLTTQAKDDPIEYIHNEVGYNYRLSNLQAALGCAQMERLEEHITAKRQLSAAYTEALRDVPGIMPVREAPWAFSTFWSYAIRIDPLEYGMDSRGLLQWLDFHGVQARPLWQPAHLSPAHAGAPVSGEAVSARLYREVVNLPSSVGLQEAELHQVVDLIKAGRQ